MICDIINLVFNKMEETFQSNTLDWSSLVFIIFFLSFSLSFSFNISIVSDPISLKLGWCIATRYIVQEPYSFSGPYGNGQGHKEIKLENLKGSITLLFSVRLI